MKAYDYHRQFHDILGHLTTIRSACSVLVEDYGASMSTEATEIVNDGKVLISIMCPICGVPVPLFSVGLRYSEDHVAACKLQVCNACGTSVSVDGWIKYAFSMRILDVKVAVPGGAEEDSDGC